MTVIVHAEGAALEKAFPFDDVSQGVTAIGT
jgi:hypothetical protein